MFRYEGYPRSLGGALNVLSMSAVEQLSLICPYICLGLDPAKTSLRNGTMPCFWKFEDAFMGSCIAYSGIGVKTIFDHDFKLCFWSDWIKNQLKRETRTVLREMFLSDIKDSAEFYKIHDLIRTKT